MRTIATRDIPRSRARQEILAHRNQTIDSDDPRKLVFEVIDEAVPAKVKELLGTGSADDEPNYAGLLNWVNVTLPCLVQVPAPSAALNDAGSH